MANTENRGVSLGGIPVRHRGFREDAFTVQHGHVIGHDGFVVPNTFEEFYRRFPNYVADWVKRRVRGCSSEPEAEDWTQELLLHLAALPNDSVWRELGKNDVIETFSPKRMHGANEARFRSFINNCLANKFNTLYTKWRKRPLSNPANLPFGPERATEASDEYCHAHSAYLRRAQTKEWQCEEARFRVREAEARLRSSVPDLKNLFDAYRITGNWEEAARRAGLSNARYSMLRYRIKMFVS